MQNVGFLFILYFLPIFFGCFAAKFSVFPLKLKKVFSGEHVSKKSEKKKKKKNRR